MKPHLSTPFWLWLNLLSLDAPIVALVWQDFVARCFPSPLRLPGRCALGLTVWAIYLADRLIDVQAPAQKNDTTRHAFYRQHRRLATVLLVAAALADLLTVLLWLRPEVFSNGLWVFAAVAVYLMGFAVLHTRSTRLKQPAAAILYAAGVFLVAWTSAQHPWHTLGRPAIVFGSLCLGNLISIEVWEQKHEGVRGWPGMLLLAVACAWLGQSRWYLAAGSSALGLGALDFWGGKLSQDARRVLADAVLLTPLLFP